MEDELARLHASYLEFIRTLIQSQRGDRPHKHARELWGAELTFEQFQTAWNRICLDPILEQYWLGRLKSVASHAAELRDHGAAA